VEHYKYIYIYIHRWEGAQVSVHTDIMPREIEREKERENTPKRKQNIKGAGNTTYIHT